MFEIENTSFSVLNSSYVLSGVYGGMGVRIENTVAGLFLSNADLFTGAAAAGESLRVLVNENTDKLAAVEDGLAMVEDNQVWLSGIGDKVDEMADLAAAAAAGGLTGTELADLQEQFTTLALEIDELAQGDLEKTSLLTESGEETVAVSTSLSITVDKENMTSEGLSLNTVDLTTAAAAAVDAVAAARSAVEDFAVHLEGRADSLQASQAVLEVQRDTLLASASAVASIDSAMLMVGMLSGMAPSHADLFLAAQAHAVSETVLSLLADSQA